MQAFTHFTWVCSNKTFAILDLQGAYDDGGNIFWLTDPAPQSTGPVGGIFSTTDVGAGSINNFFFKIHKNCNEFCGHDWHRPENRLASLPGPNNNTSTT